ncbi:sulfatase [Komagataeibacter xylinus]|uniref:sulfatase family protein n=1 Tax=Komagataeibacter xylinus TaxID=28448 RepID=UPI00102F7004|nr:sulfatase [Komagataeibacter xylinus]
MKSIRRRHVLAAASGAGTALLTTKKGYATPARKPNIIWIVCHDIHAPLIGCYGNPLARTPTIDALAHDGIRFDNVHATTPVCAPSRFSLITGIHPQSWGPAENMRAVAKVAGHIQSLPEHMQQAGYYCTNNVFTDYNCDLDPQAIWDDCSITAHWRNRPKGRPFFSVYNYLITHESHLFETTPTITDPHSVTVPPYLPDTPDVRDAIARNIDMVNRQDKAVAHILDELRQDGLTEDTVIFFLADHGGVLPRTKRYCYDGGLHVPFIAYFPRKYRHLAHRPAGRPCADLISLLDLAPSTLSLAGAPVPPVMQGRAFVGHKIAPARQYVFSGRNRMDERQDLMRSIRTSQYRYIRNYMPHRIYGQHNNYEWGGRGYQSWEEEWRAGRLNTLQAAFWREKPAEELYDIRADPHQIHNLAAHRDQQAVLVTLRGLLDQEMIALNDNAFLIEGLGMEGYAQSRAVGAYPLSDLLELSARVIARDPASVPLFVKRMQDSNPVIRYWAATGLLVLSPQLDAATVAEVEAAFRTEPLPVIKAVHAEILLDGKRSAYATPWLARSIASPDDPVAGLAALTTATYGRQTGSASLRAAVRTVLTEKHVPHSVDEVLNLFAAHAAATYLASVQAGTYDPRRTEPVNLSPAALKGPVGQLLLKAMGGRIGDPQI